MSSKEHLLKKKTALIIGAGPAGLTAAYELLSRTDIHPVIYEMTDKIGGICRTEEYNGNKIDIGGHRFFTKHEAIMDWWLNFLPLQSFPGTPVNISKNRKNCNVSSNAPNPETTDHVMLIRRRRSRIMFHNKLFDYPVSLGLNVFKGLGIANSVMVLLSYLRARLFPVRNEQTLEDFFINRFGRYLYTIFFKDYTEKLWGVPCHEISSDWGSQRIRGLSIAKAVAHALRKQFFPNQRESENMETSLIDQFYYPKFGPGQLWTAVAEEIQAKGGEIFLNHKVTGINHLDGSVSGITVENRLTQQTCYVEGDYFISTMPVKDLIQGFEPPAPPAVLQVAEGLYYRDLIIAGLLFRKLRLNNDTHANEVIPDCWLYIQDKNTRIGRIQIINNWSPYMVANHDSVWLGAECCCSRDDGIWKMEDTDIIAALVEDMVQLGIVSKEDMIDGVVVRQPNAYPAYTGSYGQLEVVRKYTDSLYNLFLIGRNGMHRYNNMDHSMMTAMKAVDAIVSGKRSKEDIWNVNTEHDYHEVK